VFHIRNRYFLVLDLISLCVTPAIALALRVDRWASMADFVPAVALYAALALLVRLAVFYRFELYRRYWRYASVEELVQIVAAVGASTAVVLVLAFGVRIPVLGVCGAWPLACDLPRSIPFIDAPLVLLAVGGSRFSVRLLDLWSSRRSSASATRRVLVMGAGDAGQMIVKEMHSNPQLGLTPVGFVDDDPRKQGARIHGVTVLGTRADIPGLVRQQQIDEVVIAMPTAPGKVIREVVKICERAEVPTRTMPGIYELLGGSVSVSGLRNVQIEDLLRREPVRTDIAGVQELIRGKRVLITGAGGSIGSELCRQVLRCRPAQLVLLGHGENSIFNVYWELRRGLVADHLPVDAISLVPVIADVRFADRVRLIFEHYRPQLIFHAAAHKHVPLMELNPAEAVTNNVLGTRNVLAAAQATGVERFVMISSDKAVNPSSIMGASKRTAELMVHQAARNSGRAYVAVRFGNVLGSRGSVVLTFKQQIAAGGPVTVTHPDVQRFFMTIPEAVQLVLQAAALGQGGEVFVLDMGQPIKIVDLARDLIELSGLEVGQDIEMVFTGLRPGEKLIEELFVPGESYVRTCHDKVFIAANASAFVPPDLELEIAQLETAAHCNDASAIVEHFHALIPEFTATAEELPVEQPGYRQPV
jgi:FlaA1/EpsC-like NDP-sugar epimerase